MRLRQPFEIDRLLALRRGLRLTQQELAQRLGVTVATISNWERGKSSPQPYLVRRLEELEREAAEVGKTAA